MPPSPRLSLRVRWPASTHSWGKRSQEAWAPCGVPMPSPSSPSLACRKPFTQCRAHSSPGLRRPLQLVLLSIIMVGQKVEGAAADTRADDTYRDAEAILHEALEIQKHLETQDALLQRLIDNFQNNAKP